MKFKENMSFLLSLLSTSIRASMGVRGAFLIEVGFMIANNLIFFILWWIFFQQFDEIAGWTLKDMLALLTIGSGAFGLMQVTAGGIRTLSRTIVNGELDPLMTQPKNILIHLIFSRSRARGWGDILTSVLYMFLGGFTDLYSITFILIGIGSGYLVFSSFGIIVHSLAFWLGPTEKLSQHYTDSLLLFALYPSNIYSGFLQFTMFTLLPAGIIGYLPVELLRSFAWWKLLSLLSGALIFCVLAFVVFYAGLRRYESGNQFGMRI